MNERNTPPDPANHAIYAARTEALFAEMRELVNSKPIPSMYVAAAAMTLALAVARNHKQVDGLVYAFGQHAADRHAELDGNAVTRTQ